MDLGSTAFGLLAFLSYRVVAVCLASVPLTHAIGVYLHCPKYLRPWRYLTFPFTGGNRHAVLQLLGWVRAGSLRMPYCGWSSRIKFLHSMPL
jgi:hypothetical protein